MADIIHRVLEASNELGSFSKSSAEHRKAVDNELTTLVGRKVAIDQLWGSTYQGILRAVDVSGENTILVLDHMGRKLRANLCAIDDSKGIQHNLDGVRTVRETSGGSRISNLDGVYFMDDLQDDPVKVKRICADGSQRVETLDRRTLRVLDQSSTGTGADKR